MRRQRLLQLCSPFILLTLLGSYGEALIPSEFFGYPFAGDNTFPASDDISLFINAMIQFPYFNNFYTGISVDINGHCTFSDQSLQSEYRSRPLESIGVPRVAPFWVDLNAGVGGSVYYRVLNSTMDDAQATLASISQQSSAVLLPDINFNVKWALLVTWNLVPYYSDSETSVTFQLVLATDGTYSVIMFLYSQETRIMSGTTIGFAAGKTSTFYQMPMNQTQSAQTWSNAGQAGLWVFRTDGGDSLTDVKGEVQFDCYWYSEVPSLLQWYKDNVMLNDTTRITGTSTNLLSVSNIAHSDFGVYQCYVEDFLSKAALLTVSPKGSVSTTPKVLQSTAGDSVSIKCCAEGGPDNMFYWSHNGEVLAVANQTISFLNVSTMSAEDLGNYTCMVTNTAGSDSSTSIIHGFTDRGPGGGLCTNYTKRVMSREVEVCLPTFSTTFSSAYVRHAVIVYSPSDRLVNSELSNQEDLLQYLYTRAQMDESANPHLLAIYGDTSNVPVSITVDGLQPNTPYLIFVQVEMLYQGVVVTSYSSEGITVMTTATTAETSAVSQTMYIATVSGMGSVIAFLVVCAALVMTVLLCRIYFIQKRVHSVRMNQPSSIDGTVQGAKYIDQRNAAGCILEHNPAYSSISLDCSSHLHCSPEDRREGENQEMYETINVQ